MFKKIILIILTLCLTTLTGSWVFAEICPNVVGEWDATVKWVNYDPDSECPDCPFCYKQFTLIFRILQQNGCLFYGYREVPNTQPVPITGVISQGTSITWNASGTLYNGILGGYNPSRRIFTQIKYTVLNTSGNTGKGIATR